MTNEEIFAKSKPYSLCGRITFDVCIDALRMVHEKLIPGDIIECGVYRGGMVMAMLYTLCDLSSKRHVYLYDTFEGMPEPEPWEKELHCGSTGVTAMEQFKKLQLSGNASDWCRESLDTVRDRLSSVGYPVDRVHFVKGMVEDTLPQSTHESVAVLRLDTDWYSSTRTELEILYPKLSPGGILLLDDYGYWSGARKAVDEYFKGTEPAITLEEVGNYGALVEKPVG